MPTNNANTVLFDNLSENFPKVSNHLKNQFEQSESIFDVAKRQGWLGDQDNTPYVPDKSGNLRPYLAPKLSIDSEHQADSVNEFLKVYANELLVESNPNGTSSKYMLQVSLGSKSAHLSVVNGLRQFGDGTFGINPSNAPYTDYDALLSDALDNKFVKLLVFNCGPNSNSLVFVIYNNFDLILSDQQLIDFIEATLTNNEEYLNKLNVKLLSEQIKHDYRMFEKRFNSDALKFMGTYDCDTYRRLVALKDNLDIAMKISNQLLQ